VLYVRPIPGDGRRFEAHMYSQDTLVKAFDANLKHTQSVGIGHLPAWLNADEEVGDRFVGSGFGDQALWKEEGDLVAGAKAILAKPDKVTAAIETAKKDIAASLGISPEAVEIVIRM
jgi:hypothetical protein